MRHLAVLGVLLAVYAALLPPLSRQLQHRPFLEKVGYVPQPLLLKIATADLKNAVAAALVFKVLIYYGSLVENERLGSELPPDHETMHAILTAASRLDPYNMDIYYFAQAMAWDFRKMAETTALLEYGMGYRDWDFYLPFFAGFNYAFFLKDYPAAAKYYALAERLSGADLFGRLASRYLYEAGQTELALAYLEMMIKSSRNEAISKSFETRRAALLEVRRIELARDRYREKNGRLPASLADLYQEGWLAGPVVDPYGGEFYLEADGTVRSTSKFAAGGKQP